MRTLTLEEFHGSLNMRGLGVGDRRTGIGALRAPELGGGGARSGVCVVEGCGEPALQGPYCWRCAVEAEALERQWQERQARKAARQGAPHISDWIFAVLTMAALLLLGWMLRGYIQAWLGMWVGGRG